MSFGYQAVQSAHALAQFIFDHAEIARDWFVNSNYLGMLSVKDENALLNLIQEAEQNDIRCSIFREPDIDNAITAIALEPGQKSKKLCSRLPLALKVYNESKRID